MLSEGRILAMKDDRSPYYYLPGGRVQLHETMENAVVREVQEELGINVRIDRPLWLNQGFSPKMSVVSGAMRSACTI